VSSVLVFGVVFVPLVLYIKDSRPEPPHWMFWSPWLLSLVTIVVGINRAFADVEEGDAALVFSWLLLLPLVMVGDPVVAVLSSCSLAGPCM
jgi:hypothetical protein